jgi:hypothetical protein
MWTPMLVDQEGDVNPLGVRDAGPTKLRGVVDG